MAQPAQLLTPVDGGRPVRTVRRPAVAARWSPRAHESPDDAVWLAFLALHVPLIMAMKASVYVATAHALVTFAVGLSCLARRRTLERLVYVMGYVVASEPLWRVDHALIFYESAKYVLVAFSILAILKHGLLRRANKAALFYFVLLLPSLLVLPHFDREEISFNMSGPFSLAMCTLFLSSQRLPVRALRNLFLTTLAPILAYAFRASVSTITAEQQIDFLRSKIATGGLGNNQASSILGLGALIAFLYLFVEKRSRLLRWVVAGAGLFCSIQAVLTFSRGGVATAAGAIVVASFFLLRDKRFRGAVVLRGILIVLFAVLVALPLLSAITYGTIEDRYSSGHLTGRDRIIEADLIAFRENPIFGVGPGESKDYHALTFRRASTHTEYSRLLAEHGLLGLVALLTLGWIVARRLLRPAPQIVKALTIGFTVWALLFMFHAAMRMAAVSFMFSLGAAELVVERRRPVAGSARPHKYRRARSGRSNIRVSNSL